MQQNPHENSPPSSPKMRTGGGEKITSSTVVIPPPTSTTLPHTFDTKGISDFESLPVSSSLYRRRRDEKKMSITTAGTTVSSSRPEVEEEDSDVDTLLIESPTSTGNDGHRQRITSSLRFGTNRSGYSDSGIFDTSSPGSTATHSLARSTTSSTKRPSVRPLVRDMYSEYTTSTPLPERAVKRARTVLSTASISLKPALDASSSTDDFYYPLDASVLLPTQRTTPLVVHRANISTPPLLPYSTTDAYIQPTGNDQETQTVISTIEIPESKPTKTKRKSVTKRFTLFRSAKTSTHHQQQQPLAAHKALSAPSDQLLSEHTTELSTCGAQAPTGIILVKTTAAVAAPGLPNFAAGAAATVMDEKPDTAGERVLQTEGDLQNSASVTLPGGFEASADSKSLESPHSGDESADSLEASWYQPHLRHSAKAKRFHKKVRRKLKDESEPQGTGGAEGNREKMERDQSEKEIKTTIGDDKLKGDITVDIPKTKVSGEIKAAQEEKEQVHITKVLPEADIIAIQEKELHIPQYDIQLTKRKTEEENADEMPTQRHQKSQPISVKMPKYKTSKIKEAESAEMENAKLETHVEEPSVELGMPEGKVDVDMPSGKVAVEKEMKSPDFHFKMPKLKMGSGKAKKPKVELESPELEAHVEVPSVELGMPEGQVDVDMPSGKVAVEKEVKSPNFQFKMPKLKFGGKAKTKAVELQSPELEGYIDIEVDIVPTVVVKTPSMTKEAPSVDVDLGGLSGELPEVDAKVELESPELEAHVEVPSVELGMPEGQVDVDMPSGKVAVEKEMKSPDFHFKMPKLKMGSGKVKKPKVELESPELEAHVEVPSVELGMPEGQVDVDMPSGKVAVEKEMKSPDFHFKMPKLKMGSGKAKTPKVELQSPELEGHVDVDGAIVPTVDLKTPSVQLEAPSVDVDLGGLSGELPEVDAKAGISPVEMKVSVPKPEIEMEMPKAEVDVDLPSGKVAVETDVQAPDFHFKMPKLKMGSGKVKKPKVELESPELEAHVEVPSVELGMPEGQVDVDMPSGKVAVDYEMLSPDVHMKKPLVNLDLRSPNSELSSPHSRVINVIPEVLEPPVSSSCPAVGIVSSDPIRVNIPNVNVTSSSSPRADTYSKDSFDVIEKDLNVPSYTVRLFKDNPSSITCASSPSPDVRGLLVNVGGRDNNSWGMDDPPAKPQRESAVPEKDKRNVNNIGTDGIDGTPHSPNAFISPSLEIYTASPSPREVGRYPSSSDITVSELESSSQGESMPISPRDFYAHSATPEFKRVTDADAIEEEGTSKKKNVFDWFHLSWRRNKRRKSAISTSSGVEDSRSPSTTGKRKPKHQKHKQRKPTTEEEDLGIQADIAPVASPTTEVPLKLEPALPREVELILAEQKTATAQAQTEPPNPHDSKGLFPKKSKSKKHSKKHRRSDRVIPTSSTENETSAPRMRQPSKSTTSEHPLRQTWHHTEATVSPISEVDQRTPPPPPIPRHLDDEIAEWLARAYRSHYAEGSPLRKPRPWSTLDFPPRNCTFLNDDYLFPYSITPTKLPSCQWKSDKEYNVPYIDDDALPLDEPEWALGESRRTLTLTSADADFWRTAIAEEEKSDASGGKCLIYIDTRFF
nr:neuroblast differentiation associated protein [Hymenolepis microstoma]